MGTVTESFANLSEYLVGQHKKSKKRADQVDLVLSKLLKPLLPAAIRCGPGTITDVRDREVGPLDIIGSIDSFPPFGEGQASKPILRVYLKYGPEGERVIRHVERASRPGRRLYRRHGSRFDAFWRPVVANQENGKKEKNRHPMPCGQLRAAPARGAFRVFKQQTRPRCGWNLLRRPSHRIAKFYGLVWRRHACPVCHGKAGP